MEATENNLIITMPTKYIRNISDILKRADIQNMSTVSPADLVQIVGRVVSIPKKIRTNKRGYEGFTINDIRVGDKVFFRYDVVFDLKAVSEKENVYRNMFEYNAKEYWLLNIQKLFGVIREDGIKMLNGYVMIHDFPEDLIHVPVHIKKFRGTKKSKIICIGNSKSKEKPIKAYSGDTVIFDPTKTSKYEINGKHFRIIQQKFLLGKI